MKTVYRTTYHGTRKYDTFSSKKAAVDQARFAIKIGNMKACVQKRLPSGAWEDVTCVRRRRRRRR